MKKTILISILLLTFGVISLNAQDKKAEAKDSEITLNVKMSCNACAEKVKKQLAFTKGVKEVTPNLEKQTVVVKYHNDKTDSDKLIASLSEIGYKADVASTACPGQKSGACCPNAKKSCQGASTHCKGVQKADASVKTEKK